MIMESGTVRSSVFYSVILYVQVAQEHRCVYVCFWSFHVHYTIDYMCSMCKYYRKLFYLTVRYSLKNWPAMGEAFCPAKL